MAANSDIPTTAIQAVADNATDFLRGRFGNRLQTNMAVGLLGSGARGDASWASDVDYYIVFDVNACSAEAERLAWATAVAQLVNEVQARLPDSHIARRVSVFWSSAEALRNGDYDVGRWPMYDRLGYRQCHRHLAGVEFNAQSIPAHTHAELACDSANFISGVMGAHVQAAGLLNAAAGIESALLSCPSHVVTKCVLMPVRTLYTLLDEAASAPVVSTASAVDVCRNHHGSESWWPLVEAALSWRQSATTVRADPLLLEHHLSNLYRFLLRAYTDAMLAQGQPEAAEALTSWHAEHLRGPTAAPSGFSPQP